MRAVKLSERVGINFTAEAFNLLNRTNWSSVNNVDPGAITSLKGNAADPTVQPIGQNPFGFASAFPRRQLQFGARFVF